MSGISSLLGAIVAIIIVAAVGIGVVNYHDRMLRNQSAIAVAEQTAHQYDEFAQALNAYVKSNFNNNIIGTVSCATLQQDNYLSSSFDCTDPLGETLEGDVSEPWGFPQTWIVYPSTAPNQDELSKYGISSALQWKSFTYMVAQDAMNENKNFKGFNINGGSSFTMPDSGVSSNLSNYFLSSTSNVEFPQAVPSIGYYDDNSIIVSPSMQKNPDYWLFSVSMYLAGNTADISYQNLGYSVVCPVGGIQPGVPQSWTFTMGNLDGINSNSFVNYTDISFSYLNNNIYLCIPVAKSIININRTVFIDDSYNGPGNYNPNQMNYNAPNNKNGTNDSYDTNVENQIIPQAGQVYYINNGISKYTFIIAEGIVFFNPIWQAYYEGAILLEGQPSQYSDLYIESSGSLGGGGVPSAPVWPVSDISNGPITITF